MPSRMLHNLIVFLELTKTKYNSYCMLFVRFAGITQHKVRGQIFYEIIYNLCRRRFNVINKYQKCMDMLCNMASTMTGGGSVLHLAVWHDGVNHPVSFREDECQILNKHPQSLSPVTQKDCACNLMSYNLIPYNIHRACSRDVPIFATGR